jgi:CHASE2 domain-containing sensor protein
MTKTTSVSLWVPRIAGIGMAIFLSFFALDAFDGKPLLEALPEFAVHLAPAVVVLSAVAMGWRFPLIGAGAFAALAIGYALAVNGRLDWAVVISGPLAMIAGLFLVSGLRRVA